MTVSTAYLRCSPRQADICCSRIAIGMVVMPASQPMQTVERYSQVAALTVGDLRRRLAHLPETMPVRVSVLDDLGSSLGPTEYAVIAAGQASRMDGGAEVVMDLCVLEADWPSDHFLLTP